MLTTIAKAQAAGKTLAMTATEIRQDNPPFRQFDEMYAYQLASKNRHEFLDTILNVLRFEYLNEL